MDTKKLRQKILDLAIRGKLVPQDPNDEPASVLLERIRAEKERLIKEGKIKRCKKTATDDKVEAPFEIPESWIACKLEDIAYIGTGATPDTRNNDYYNGIIPWVSSSCTKYDYIDTPTSYITQKAIDETNCRIYPKGTLIMAMYGEGKTRGQISELKIDAATNQACAAIVPYIISTAQYIKLYLKRSYLHIREQAEGGTQPNLNLSKIALYDIFLPPLNEQRRIVNEVERWFTVIDALESNEGDLLKAIDHAKSKILDLAIHGKLVPQDPNDEPAIELLKRINPKFEPCDNALYDNLPNSWCISKLEDIIELLDNKRVPVKSEERAHRIKGKTSLYPYYGATGLVGFIDDFLLDGRYILVGEDGAPFTERYANVAYEVNGKIWVNNHAHILSPQICFEYLLHFLNTIDYSLYAKGTTRLKLTQKDMLSIPVIVPPYQEQFRIVAKIEELFAALDSIKESLDI